MIGLLPGLKAKLIGAAALVGAVFVWIWRIRVKAHRRGRDDALEQVRDAQQEDRQDALDQKRRIETAVGGADHDELYRMYQRHGGRGPRDG